MSDIGLTLSSKEAKHHIVKDSQHFRRVALPSCAGYLVHPSEKLVVF